MNPLFSEPNKLTLEFLITAILDFLVISLTLTGRELLLLSIKQYQEKIFINNDFHPALASNSLCITGLKSSK